jgi:hypothetical protein
MKRSKAKNPKYHDAVVAHRAALLNQPADAKPKPEVIGRRPWPMVVKVGIGVGMAGSIALAYIPISEWIRPDNTCESTDRSGCIDYNLTNTPPEGGTGAEPQLAPMPNNMNAPANMRAGEKVGLVVCKGMVFINNDTGVEITDPIVGHPVSGAKAGLFPRDVNADGNNIIIGGITQPTEYSWKEADGDFVAKVDYCGPAKSIVAESFGPADPLALHEEGVPIYPNLPLADQEEGIVNVERPIR